MATPTISGSITVNKSSSSRTGANFSHTGSSGSNRVLAAFFNHEGNENVAYATYNGVHLERAIYEGGVASAEAAGGWWFLINPASGSNTFDAQYQSSQNPDAVVLINIEGADQTYPIGHTTKKQQGSGTQISDTLTTDFDNSLVFCAACFQGGDTDPFTPDSGITERWDDATGTSSTADIGIFGGSRTTTTKGAHGIGCTASASDDSFLAGIEIVEPQTWDRVIPEQSNISANISSSSRSSWTQSHTVPSLTRGLLKVAPACNGNATIDNVTFDGDALTEIATVTTGTGGSTHRTSAWYMKDPDAKTANIEVTLSGSSNHSGHIAQNFSNVLQSDPIGDFDTGMNANKSNIEGTITCDKPGSAVFMAHSSHGTDTAPHAGHQNQINQDEQTAGTATGGIVLSTHVGRNEGADAFLWGSHLSNNDDMATVAVEIHVHTDVVAVGLIPVFEGCNF